MHVRVIANSKARVLVPPVPCTDVLRYSSTRTSAPSSLPPSPPALPPPSRRLLQVSYRLNTVRVELYNSYDDDVRFGLEIVLSMWIFGMLLWNLWEVAYTQVGRPRGPRAPVGTLSPYATTRWAVASIGPRLVCACAVSSPFASCCSCR